MNYLSIDVGGTFTKYGLIDHSGNFVDRWKLPSTKNLDNFKIQIKAQIQAYEPQIKGVAISCPGKINSVQRIIETGGALTYLAGFNIRPWIQTFTDLPFAIINDGKAAALAEWWIGELKDIENAAAIVLGTGVGGGFILDNQLYKGPHFQAGELSFLIHSIDENKQAESYGKRGSAVHFIHTAAQILQLEGNEFEVVFEEIIRGRNEELTSHFNRYCQDIAHLIINLQSTLDLEKVVIGGGISEQDILIQGIIAHYRDLRSKIPWLAETFAPIEISACAYRNSSNLLGALYQLFLDLENDT